MALSDVLQLSASVDGSLSLVLDARNANRNNADITDIEDYHRKPISEV